MNDRIDAIRARLNAATPGPWAIWHDLDHQGFTTVGDADSYEEILAHGECEESNPTAHVYVEEDADLIANAPADIAFLLAELDAARGRLAEAWDEGAVTTERYYLGDGPEPRNPYRQEPTG